VSLPLFHGSMVDHPSVFRSARRVSRASTPVASTNRAIDSRASHHEAHLPCQAVCVSTTAPARTLCRSLSVGTGRLLSPPPARLSAGDARPIGTRTRCSATCPVSMRPSTWRKLTKLVGQALVLACDEKSPALVDGAEKLTPNVQLLDR
jgi:hypothetical protein